MAASSGALGDSTRWPSQCGPTGCTSLLRKRTRSPRHARTAALLASAYDLFLAGCGARSPGSRGRTRPAPRPNCRDDWSPSPAAPRSGRRPSPAWAAFAAGCAAPSRVSITMETQRHSWCGPGPRRPPRGGRRWPRGRLTGGGGAGGAGWGRAPPDGRTETSELVGEGHAGRTEPAGAEGRVLAPQRGSLGLRVAELGARLPDSVVVLPVQAPAPHLHQAPQLLDLRRQLLRGRLLGPHQRQGGRGRPSGRPGRRAAQDRRQLHGVDVSSSPPRGAAPGAAAA